MADNKLLTTNVVIKMGSFTDKKTGEIVNCVNYEMKCPLTGNIIRMRPLFDGDKYGCSMLYKSNLYKN